MAVLDYEAGAYAVVDRAKADPDWTFKRVRGVQLRRGS
jgi:hypothetical protein